MARRSITTRRASALATLAGFFFAFSLRSATAQEVRVEHSEKRVQIFLTGSVKQPSGYTSLKPIPYQPFKYELPPGHPVDPDSKIVLPNRRVVTVREYIDSLNRIESGLAQVGHTMRAGSGHVIGPKYADEALFARQVAAYHSSITGKLEQVENNAHVGGLERMNSNRGRSGTATLARGSTRVITERRSSQATKTGKGTPLQSPDLSGVKDIIRMTGGTAEYFNQGFSGSFGDSNFGANFAAHLKISGSTSGAAGDEFSNMVSEMQATADMEAGAQIMGNRFPLFQFNASCGGSDKTNSRSYDLGLYVGGVQIFHDQDSSKGPAVNWQDGFSVNWDAQSPTFIFPLFGPFEMKGFVGVKGGAGLTGSFRVRSFSVEGALTPYVTASAYGEITAGVDLGVASADVGVDANLVLLDDHLNFKLDAGLAWDPQNHFTAVQNCALTNDLTSMSGSFSLVAHVYGPWGFKLYDWSTELAGWPGETSHLEFIKPAMAKLDWH